MHDIIKKIIEGAIKENERYLSFCNTDMENLRTRFENKQAEKRDLEKKLSELRKCLMKEDL